MYFKIFNQKQDGHHHTTLVDLLLFLPVASSDAERGFLELKMTILIGDAP
jgi:hypothetical protein